MAEGLIRNPTQEERIFIVLEEADGRFVNGRKFLHEMQISQFHARIHSLQRKGKLSGDFEIVASETGDEGGFKSYRLLKFDKQLSLI